MQVAEAIVLSSPSVHLIGIVRWESRQFNGDGKHTEDGCQAQKMVSKEGRWLLGITACKQPLAYLRRSRNTGPQVPHLGGVCKCPCCWTREQLECGLEEMV